MPRESQEVRDPPYWESLDAQRERPLAPAAPAAPNVLPPQPQPQPPPPAPPPRPPHPPPLVEAMPLGRTNDIPRQVQLPQEALVPTLVGQPRMQAPHPSRPGFLYQGVQRIGVGDPLRWLDFRYSVFEGLNHSIVLCLHNARELGLSVNFGASHPPVNLPGGQRLTVTATSTILFSRGGDFKFETIHICDEYHDGGLLMGTREAAGLGPSQQRGHSFHGLQGVIHQQQFPSASDNTAQQLARQQQINATTVAAAPRVSDNQAPRGAFEFQANGIPLTGIGDSMQTIRDALPNTTWARATETTNSMIEPAAPLDPSQARAFPPGTLAAARPMEMGFGQYLDENLQRFIDDTFRDTDGQDQSYGHLPTYEDVFGDDTMSYDQGPPNCPARGTYYDG